MEWEVLDAGGQFDGTLDELDYGVDQEHKFSLMLAEGQDPEFDGVIELPAIHVLHGVLTEVVPGVSEMEAQLTDVQESKLVAVCNIEVKHLNKTVLGRPQTALDTESPSSTSALFREFEVHLLDGIFEVGVVRLLGQIHNKML